MSIFLKHLILSVTLMLSALLFVSVGQAHAQNTTPFASFSETGSGELFTFTNNGPNSTFTGSSIPVNFVFVTANGYGAVDQNIAATLTFTSTVTAPAGSGNGSDQQGSIHTVATFSAVTPVDGKKTLLSFTSVNGIIQGTDGTDNAVFSNSTKVGRTGYAPGMLSFSSDFLDFSNTHDRNFQIGLDPLQDTAPGQIDDGLTVGDDGYLESFGAFGSGTFGSNPLPLSTVPEPSPLVGIAIFMTGIGFLMIVRKAKQNTGF